MSLNIQEILLKDSEYVKQEVTKDSIVIHHTAGSHRPDWVVKSWDKDNSRVCTHYVIGGKSIKDGDTSWDGKVIRCFDEKYWGYHLGVKTSNSKALNSRAIGIEICNYGPIKKKSDGKFYNYVDGVVPAEDVIKLPGKFRGYEYYHKYTDAQIESTRQLILEIAARHNVDLNVGLKTLLLNQGQEAPATNSGGAMFEVPKGSVLEQQKWLNANGFKGSNGQPLIEDGIYGASTKYAIEQAEKTPLKMPDGLSLLEQQKWLNRNGFVGANGKPLTEDGLSGRNTTFALDAYKAKTKPTLPDGLSLLEQQKWLNKHGYKGADGKPLTEDGLMGRNTQYAIDAAKGGSATPTGLFGPFELNPDALAGKAGLWTHTSYRKDKYDCSPQPNLIAMLKGL